MFQKISQHKWYGLTCLLACFVTAIIYLRNETISLASIPITLVMVGLVLFLPTKKDWSIFLGIAVSGILFSIVTPVLNSPDEYVHLARSFHIASGEINLGNEPENLVITEDFFSILDDYINPPLAVDNYNHPSTNKTTHFRGLIDFRATNAYWFIGYLPQVTGIVLGRMIGLGVGFIFYLGRICNAICYAALAYLAVRLSGKFRQLMLLIVLLPMNLFLAGTYNQDSTALGLIYVIIGYFIHMISSKHPIQNKEVLLYTTLCSILISLKLPYVLLIGLLLFIPKERFNIKHRYLKLIAAILLVISLTVLWFISYQQIHSAAPLKNVGVAKQLAAILSNPSKALTTLLREFFLTPYRLIMLFYFGLLDLPMKELLIPLFFFYTTAFLSNMNRLSLSLKTRLGSIVIALSIIAGIITVMYLTWTPVGLSNVHGIQGRYYLGVLPLLALGVTATKSKRLQLPSFSDECIFKSSLIILATVLIFTITVTY